MAQSNVAPGGTEPILIFADVFDPAQSQLDGMVRLFQVRDFVAVMLEAAIEVRARTRHRRARSDFSTQTPNAGL